MPVAAWFADLLKCELHGRVDLSDHQIAQLYEHYELLQRWNRKINLTSIPSGPEAVVRHYCESPFFSTNLTVTEKATIADFCSGTAFPGLPVPTPKPESTVALREP